MKLFKAFERSYKRISRVYGPRLTHRVRFALIGVLFILLAAGWIIWGYRQRTPSTQEFYGTELTNLEKAVKDIPESLTAQVPINESLEQYDQQLGKVMLPCERMLNYHQNLKDQAQDSMGETINKVNELCKDVVLVATYSRSLYQAAEPYIEFRANWPRVEDHAYSGSLLNARQTIRHTKSGLNKVDNSRTQDPALQELIIQLDQVEKVAASIESARNNKEYSKAASLSDNFIKLLDGDKTDFLNARHYFWNNTVGINALLQAINGLQAEFKSKE